MLPGATTLKQIVEIFFITMSLTKNINHSPELPLHFQEQNQQDPSDKTLVNTLVNTDTKTPFKFI